MDNKNTFLGTEPIGKLMRGYAVPCIISLLVGALYNIVDQIFIANASYLGSYGNAANTVVFPLTVVALGIAVMVGDGCCAYVSMALGRGEPEKAKRSVGNAVVLTLAASLVLTAVYLLFADGIIAMFGGTVNEETFRHSREYFFYITLGIPFYMFGQAMNPIIRADGSPKFAMVSTLTGAVINIILDPILIHGWFGVPALGIAGAAIATVIGQFASAALVWCFNFKFNPEVQLAWKYVKLHGQIVRSILTVGIPSVVMNGIGSVMNFGMNQILQGFTETATGVFGVYFKLQSFFFMPLFGLNNATISIIAYNYGARKPQRITKTLKIACTAAVCLMLTGFLAFQFAPDLLIGMFNPSETFLVIGRAALRTISWSFPLAAFGIALSGCFQALGNGIYSTIVSLCRQMLVLLPVAYLLSKTGEVNAVWLSFIIAEVISLAVTLTFFRRIYRQKIQPLFAAKDAE